MKKKLICLPLAFIMWKLPATQSLKVEAPFEVWSKHVNKLEAIRKVVDQSDLPHQQVKFVSSTIDSLEMLIVPQIQRQLNDTTKKK